MAEKRLIYAEDLFEPVDCSVLMLRKGGQQSGKTVAMYEEIFRKRVELAPTIDAELVVHGRWKYYHKQNIAVCTNCSFERDLSANFGKAISCPNCGAKMDGKDYE